MLYHEEYFFNAPSTLGKTFSRRHIDFVFLFFPKNKFWYFTQIVSRRFAWNVKSCFFVEKLVNYQLYCWISSESGKGKDT